MGIRCGSQITICDVPVRLDTYKGCSHACAYCFVKRKKDISLIERDNCVKALKSFLSGKRSVETNWCDWDIPLHWGGMSDPFQPAERIHKISLECLKLFAETKYPVIISTKSCLICEPEYLDLLKQCNVVVQISMVCDKYDKLELGASTYKARLEMIKTLKPHVRRIIARVQPYMLEVFQDVCGNIPKLADAGAYGLTIEGMKFVKKKRGLVKVAGDYCYPEDRLRSDFIRIKTLCHQHGLSFYCAENRLRPLGDDMCCCGIDGLPGFLGNVFNVSHLKNGEKVKPTEHMNIPGTAKCFGTIHQDTVSNRKISTLSFTDMMLYEAKKTLSGKSF